MSIKPAALLASLLSGLGLMSAPAMAEIIQGPYVIEARYPKGPGPSGTDYVGCLFIGENGKSDTPSLFDWGADATHLCGQPTGPVSQAAIWDIYVVSDSPARSVYVIRSRFSGKCLIRGNGGAAENPTPFRWPDSTNPSYCGFPSLSAFMNNGQAGWDLDMKDIGLDDRGLHMFEGAISMAMPERAYLDISALTFDRPVRVPDRYFPKFETHIPAWKFRLRLVTQYP